MTVQEIIDNKMTWGDVMRTFKPELTDDEVEFILWGKTCYPFDIQTTINQIEKLLSPTKINNMEDTQNG